MVVVVVVVSTVKSRGIRFRGRTRTTGTYIVHVIHHISLNGQKRFNLPKQSERIFMSSDNIS